MFFDLRYACQEQPETKGICRLDQLLDGERVGELKRASLEDAPVIAIAKAAHHVRVVLGQFCGLFRAQDALEAADLARAEKALIVLIRRFKEALFLFNFLEAVKVCRG